MLDQEYILSKYENLLQHYFEREEERAFFEVAELAKELVNSRFGPDILLDIHNQCLKKIIENLDPMTIGRVVVNANELLLNGIMAYAMSYYNFLDILERQKKELEKTNSRLQELDRLKSMFIASMSHELRTPLNSIIGFTSILLEEWVGPLNSEQKENLAIILRSGKHLLSLINDIIDVSKIEAGLIEAEISEFDIYELIKEAITSVSKDIREKGLELKVEIIHEKLQTDRRRLLQCVWNLLSNALKFTEKGMVAVKTNMIRQSDSGPYRNFLEIKVIDTGIGIKEEDVPKLFQPFLRLESPLKHKTLGTGLGLYLTKKIVNEILKGEIEVKTQYGQGSTFTLRIPKKEIKLPD